MSCTNAWSLDGCLGEASFMLALFLDSALWRDRRCSAFPLCYSLEQLVFTSTQNRLPGCWSQWLRALRHLLCIVHLIYNCFLELFYQSGCSGEVHHYARSKKLGTRQSDALHHPSLWFPEVRDCPEAFLTSLLFKIPYARLGGSSVYVHARG